MQGDLDKQREGVVFLTIHDVGQSYLSWVNFVNTQDMEEVRRRSVPDNLITHYWTRPDCTGLSLTGLYFTEVDCTGPTELDWTGPTELDSTRP